MSALEDIAGHSLVTILWVPGYKGVDGKYMAEYVGNIVITLVDVGCAMGILPLQGYPQ